MSVGEEKLKISCCLGFELRTFCHKACNVTLTPRIPTNNDLKTLLKRKVLRTKNFKNMTEIKTSAGTFGIVFLLMKIKIERFKLHLNLNFILEVILDLS